MARDPVAVALNAARRAGWFPDPNMMRIALAAVTPLIQAAERERCAALAMCPLDQPCHADVLLELANAPLRCEAV